jgi:hypothetical protein
MVRLEEMRQATRAALNGRFSLRELPVAPAKGKSGLVKVYSVEQRERKGSQSLRRIKKGGSAPKPWPRMPEISGGSAAKSDRRPPGARLHFKGLI